MTQQPDKVQRALDNGELWRAKEILRGRIRNMPFDALLFERYGQVLLRTGDNLEAGMFLLLSGVRKPEYVDAIALFLRRYSRGRWERSFSTFPRSVRRCRWSELPAAARNDLAKLGVPVSRDGDELFFGPWRRRNADISNAGCVVGLLALAAIGFVIAVFIVHFFLE